MNTPTLIPRLIFAVMLTAFFQPSFAAETNPVESSSIGNSSVEKLAKRLSSLRGEVEELQSMLDNKKDQHKNRMSSLSMQRAELEAGLQRNGLEYKQLKKTLKARADLAKENGVSSKYLKPQVITAIHSLKEHMAYRLPFKLQERMSALNEIADQVELDVITPHKAVNRLWAFFDDEIRMTKETALYRQPVALPEGEVLADVVRVGMMMLFFKTNDGRYGKVVKTDLGWKYLVLADNDDIEKTALLFDAMKKQIRSGYFELPGQLAKVEK